MVTLGLNGIKLRRLGQYLSPEWITGGSSVSAGVRLDWITRNTAGGTKSRPRGGYLGLGSRTWILVVTSIMAQRLLESKYLGRLS